MRQLCKYLVALSLLLSASLNYTMDNIKLDTSNVTKAGCCSPCGGGGCGPCGGGCCGPCGSSCNTCCSPCGEGSCCNSNCNSCCCGFNLSGCCGSCQGGSGGSCGCGPFCGSCDCCDSCCQASSCGYPFFAYRSTSVNAARDIVGIQEWINRYDMDSTYGAFSIALEYTRSFRPSRIAKYLFGRDLMGCNTLAIQGSEVENKMCCSWLADYFGLAPDFDSRVSFCPRIENIIVNFDFYLGVDHAQKGVFMRFHSPLTWTRWSLNMCECVVSDLAYTGRFDTGFAAGYMSEDEILLRDLPQSFTEAISGCAKWGDMQSPLCFGRMTPCKLTKVKLADLHSVFGYNFTQSEDYHLGVNVRVVLPTGTRPCAKYLFEPQIGDQKHWQLGGGLTSSWILWRNDDNDDNFFGVWFDANLLHLFSNCQCRSFDFCCKPNSRYMLLEKMGTNDDEISGPAGTFTPQYQYKKSLIPAINYTTYSLQVKIALQADLALKFGYVNDNCSVDFGYNLWARTGEKYCSDDKCCCCACPVDTLYAIKGDSQLYGAYTTPVPDENFALSSSQSKADIHSGENMKLAAIPARVQDSENNFGVDNPELAFKGGVGADLLDSLTSGSQVYTSIKPKIVSFGDINFCKSPSALSHKVFAHFSYAWKDREEDWTPYLGVGCEAEFDGGCSGSRFAVSQWGIWLKGGIAFASPAPARKTVKAPVRKKAPTRKVAKTRKGVKAPKRKVAKKPVRKTVKPMTHNPAPDHFIDLK